MTTSPTQGPTVPPILGTVSGSGGPVRLDIGPSSPLGPVREESPTRTTVLIAAGPGRSTGDEQVAVPVATLEVVLTTPGTHAHRTPRPPRRRPVHLPEDGRVGAPRPLTGDRLGRLQGVGIRPVVCPIVSEPVGGRTSPAPTTPTRGPETPRKTLEDAQSPRS